MSSLQILLFSYLTVINLTTLLTFGRDKYRAKSGGRRVSEKTLLILTAIGGGVGALIGQSLFRHKTTKGAFVWKFWVIIFVWIVVVVWYMIQQ